MKFLSTFVLLAALSVFVEAASFQHDHIHRSDHKRISRRAGTGRCKPRNPQINVDTEKNNTKNGEPKKEDEPKKDNSKNNPSKSDPAPNTNGLIKIDGGKCGPNGATKHVTKTTGPNGSIDWLNCGIEGSGWTPPYIGIHDLITVNLDDAIAQGGPFTGCTSYIWAFKQFGAEFGLPPILLASIALQESSCNPHTVGGAGEQGLMQLTHDKCGNAPNGNCQDVGYNVRTGAKYFADTLAANGGDFLKTLGAYNGWQPGMDVDYATRMRWTFCRTQNNLDYLHQTCNGWLLNKDAYKLGLGKYFNLRDC